MLKPIIRIVLLVSLLAGWTGTLAGRSYAQTAATSTPTSPRSVGTPTPLAPAGSVTNTVPLSGTENLVSLSLLNYGEVTMHGPFDNTRYAFSLPATWQLIPGAELHLDMELFTDNPVTFNGSVGSLEVDFNDQWVTSIPLSKPGRHNLTLPIPTQTLTSTRSDGSHRLSFILASSLDCHIANIQPTVIVYPTAYLILPHRLIPPALDLARLPWPLYQAALEPDAATLVVPDQPTASELQAALTVALAFGNLTSGTLLLSFTPESHLSAADRAGQHLIFVGQAGSFHTLSDLTALAAPIGAGKFNAPDAQPEDGIIQLAVSPWNPARVVLLVGGNSDAAVVKAAQALSAAPLRTTAQPALALIDRVQLNAPPTLNATDQTLSDLGRPETLFQSIGTSAVDVLFFVPPGLASTPEAYFELGLTHSSQLSYDLSGVIVKVNDAPIGSVRLSDETALGADLKFAIPPALIQPGSNRLTIQVALIPASPCINPLANNLWMAVQNTSVLHLPLNPVTGAMAARLDLQGYPSFFNTDATLSNVAFVVPAQDPASWRAAAQVAFYLGRNSDARLADIALAFGDAVPETLRQQRDLIILGRPSELPLVAELQAALPAPFEAGSDVAAERNSLVVYRLPTGASIGYIQLLAAPWNSDRFILAALGNTDLAQQWVSAVLTTPSLRSKLAGNLAVVNDQQIYSTDTRVAAPVGSVTATAVPGGTEEPPVIPPPPAQREAWLSPAVAATTGAMALVVIIAVVVALFERKRQRQNPN